MTEWKNVLRILHLQGGLRVVNPPGPLCRVEPLIGSGILEFRIKTYPDLFGRVRGLGLEIMGCAFYQDQSEIEEWYPPEWRVYPLTRGSWPSFENYQTWRQIAHAGFEADDMELYDISSRIAFHIYLCSIRLFELCKKYGAELDALCHFSKFRSHHGINSKNSIFLYAAAQSFIIELCILRDYVAEFLAEYVFNIRSKSGGYIRSMSILLRELRNTGVNVNGDLACELLSAGDSDGKMPSNWLARLSAYRDLLVHYAPLARIQSAPLVIQKTYHLKEKHELPMVILPLPSDPFEMKRHRSGHTVFKNKQDWMDRLKAVGDSIDDMQDLLEYGREALCFMLDLTTGIATHSPRKPMPIHLTRENFR